MNLKVRIKNWGFWACIAIAIFSAIFTYYGVTASDITTWAGLGELLLKAISNPFVVFNMLMAIGNALVDPTTKGITDSQRAMSYLKPGGGDED